MVAPWIKRRRVRLIAEHEAAKTVPEVVTPKPSKVEEKKVIVEPKTDVVVETKKADKETTSRKAKTATKKPRRKSTAKTTTKEK